MLRPAYTFFLAGAAATLLLLGGCNSFPSKNIDPQRDNKAAYSKDLRECKEDHPESGAGLHFHRWADCMNLKGWR